MYNKPYNLCQARKGCKVIWNRRKINDIFDYTDKKTFTYYGILVNFFYSEFDDLSPREKKRLYIEMEQVREYLNTPMHKEIETDKGTVAYIIEPNIIKKEDVYPPIYKKYIEHRIQKNETFLNFLKSIFKRIQNIEYRT